jgi:hypothetical protein
MACAAIGRWSSDAQSLDQARSLIGIHNQPNISAERVAPGRASRLSLLGAGMEMWHRRLRVRGTATPAAIPWLHRSMRKMRMNVTYYTPSHPNPQPQTCPFDLTAAPSAPQLPCSSLPLPPLNTPSPRPNKSRPHLRDRLCRPRSDIITRLSKLLTSPIRSAILPPAHQDRPAHSLEEDPQAK